MGCAPSTLLAGGKRVPGVVFLDKAGAGEAGEAAPQAGKVFKLVVDASSSRRNGDTLILASPRPEQAALSDSSRVAGDGGEQQRGRRKQAGSRHGRRLSLPGSALAKSKAFGASPEAGSTGSAPAPPSARTASTSSSGGDAPSQPPVALSAQPALPEAAPLPQRRVRFDDSPVKTHKLPEEEAAEEEEAATTPHAQPRATARVAVARFTQPLPASARASPQQRPLTKAQHQQQAQRQEQQQQRQQQQQQQQQQQPADQQACQPEERAEEEQQQRMPSPSKAIFEAALAARGAAAAAPLSTALLTTPGSPSKAAAAAAVPMSHLIHSVASLSRAGKEPTYRKTNQDACFAYQQYCRPNQALLAALDGHGPHGHTVSQYLQRHMPLAVAEQLGEAPAAQAPLAANASFSSTAGTAGVGASGTGSGASGGVGSGAPAPAYLTPREGPRDAASALAYAFLQLDAQLAAVPDLSVQYSGSTAVVCLLQGRRVTTAWVGDSKAVLARADPRAGLLAIPLTRDHKPNHPDERARILAAGGRVERLVDARGTPVGPQRVWLASSWVPGLAMSRAIGDAVAHAVGVSSEPETSVVELSPQDRWLLLATDGVWEFLDPQAAVDLISGCKDAEDACRTLVDVAWAKWLHEEEGAVDDITVVAVRLNPH